METGCSRVGLGKDDALLRLPGVESCPRVCLCLAPHPKLLHGLLSERIAWSWWPYSLVSDNDREIVYARFST